MTDILIIHPDKKLVGLYMKRLSSLYSVDSAYDGLDGLRKINMLLPNLVVSEYDLPFLSGYSLLKHVRSHKTLHSIPFLFLSDQPFAHEVMEHSANDWITTRQVAPEWVVNRVDQHYFTNKHLIKVSKYV